MELLSNTTFADLKHNAGEPPIWGDRNTIFGIITGWVLGLTSSSAIATFYSLQGIYDSVQIFALILTSVVHISAENTLNTWKKLFLGTVPNILALNISVLTQSIVFFTIFQIVTLLLVLYFHHATDRFVREQPMHEGLVELPEAIKGRGWDVLFVSFLLIILYLPISTLTVHGLVWTSDFWPVPNPYLNATTFPPQVPPLGPSWEYRDPLDFCWTTTMKKDSLNWAPFVVIFSLFSFTVFTVYFPVRLWLTIRQCLPHVDKFSELGRLRNASELEQEYQRLLVRDSNPLSFLYNDFRRTWGAYKSIYLVMKLLALLTVAVIDPNNCIFRNSSHSHINIIRQSVLLVETVTALIFQSVLAPFIDPISNASEWISRVGYVATSFVGLLVATNVKGSDVLNGPVLYVIYVLNYGLNIYFAIIGFGWVRLIIKRIAQRLDFSIDMFSPQLDISSNSVHVKRRIYQESVSALLLASPSCLMPKGQKVVYNEPSDSSWPPYLMGFMGSPAERHAENLKIMREVGADAYKRGVDMYYGPKRDRYKAAQRRIEREFVGPDAFWHPEGVGVKGCSHYFGNAWWIPFPPSVVLRYDHGPVVVLTTIEELEAFVAQNASLAIEEKRKVRLALRALDGHIVVWPHTHIELVGARAWNPFGGPQYKIQTTTEYQSCTFEIKRNGVASWNGIQLGSGFNIQMQYSHCLELDGSIIGLDDDFNMTPQLAQFLLLNRDLVNDQHPILLATLDDYRTFMRKMAKWKREVLSYRFLTTVYGSPSNPETVIQTVEDMERDLRVRDLVVNRQDAFSAAYERLKTVAASRVRTWWYLLWDDMWRQNSSAISAMRLHETDFNPQYPTSIAYRPLPRAVLEAFLSQRGLYAGNGKGGYIHVGFLNKVYVRMSQIAFNGASRSL
ncbi:hypothetical protein FRB99_008521 [Tulasnella sp. 403]|nr:hypothetical protein FRB99_008521 [Tulasnella sp. 403]